MALEDYGQRVIHEVGAPSFSKCGDHLDPERCLLRVKKVWIT